MRARRGQEKRVLRLRSPQLLFVFFPLMMWHPSALFDICVKQPAQFLQNLLFLLAHSVVAHKSYRNATLRKGAPLSDIAEARQQLAGRERESLPEQLLLQRRAGLK